MHPFINKKKSRKITQPKKVRINRRNRSTKTVKRDQSTRVHRSSSENIHDRDKDVKTYKRDRSIKGEDT